MNTINFKAFKSCLAAVTVAIACFVVLAGCETKDDRSDCAADITFRFEYTANSTRADLFTEKAERADLFIYDADGGFVKNIRVSREDGTLKSDNRVKVSLPHGRYTVVSWANMDETYLCKYDCELPDYRLTLITTDGMVNDIPAPLMHADKDLTVNNKTAENEVVLSMTNDKKNITVVLNVKGNQSPVTTGDFNVSILSRNGVYKHDNSLAECDLLQYIGSYSVAGWATFTSNLRTLRLMPNDDSRLLIGRNYNTRGEITLPCDLSLTGEIMKHPSYTTQEDLDRESQFTLVYDIDISGDWTYVVTLIKINDWDVVGQGGSVK